MTDGRPADKGERSARASPATGAVAPVRGVGFQQVAQKGPRLLDTQRTPMLDKLIDYGSDRLERMVPGPEHILLRDQSVYDIATEGVVEGHRVIGIIPFL